MASNISILMWHYNSKSYTLLELLNVIKCDNANITLYIRMHSKQLTFPIFSTKPSPPNFLRILITKTHITYISLWIKVMITNAKSEAFYVGKHWKHKDPSIKTFWYYDIEEDIARRPSFNIFFKKGKSCKNIQYFSLSMFSG